MKFKAEILLLSSAIILYFISAFCYSYEAHSQGWLPVLNYPLRSFAIPLAVIASILLMIAAFLYVKRK
ncbi:hypothetical protein J7L49_01925 [Candidatus Bathyarchaeota archaeon]|nr:hypothetical protein [Candidatus Bathyarchaeota archaeon]